MKKIKLLCCVVLSAIMPSVYAATQAERIAELERIALYEEEDDIDNNENEIIPTPADARRKFNLTDAQLFEDIKILLGVLQKIVDQGNTVVVIEHNLDVLKSVDWLIDLGPEGGSAGGCIIAEGTPEEVAANKNSYTGEFLKEIL